MLKYIYVQLMTNASLVFLNTLAHLLKNRVAKLESKAYAMTVRLQNLLLKFMQLF